ncbi:hypothetical protein ANCCAN_16526 [Ancylostoma caninum]|uniref:Uncharacterized protein n=1 Tax=Ancylostoma caninum TaxID=29170 RepID=A0A368FZE1_ANCCA|nr:hypothetical protein ANCCAN_16526 [Ancylostoma caninum]
MDRALVLLCILGLVAALSAGPVAVIDRFVPIAVDGVPFHRFKRQWGWGMPVGGSFGNSWGYSSSSSFMTYNTGYNTGWWG